MSLVFLCGPHGAGKTTLASRLQTQPDIVLPELYTRSVKLHTDPYERIKLKTCARVLENYEMKVLSEEQPEKIVLGNRCIYDTYAYAQCYASLQWITQDELYSIYGLAQQVFDKELIEPRAVVLNPPFETVWSRLQQRWKSKEKKWEEENAAYCKAACNAYEQFSTNPHVLYIQDNTVTPELLEWLQTSQQEHV